MKNPAMMRPLLGILLSAVLVLTAVCPGYAVQETEETVPPAETTAVTEPVESNPETQPEETQPEQTEEPIQTQPEEAVSETQPEQTELTVEESAPEQSERKWKLYFGQLHAHTALSGGKGTVEEAFSYASNVEGLDFFAVTDHSNALDNAEAGSINQDGSAISADWAAGKAAAAAVTNENFVGIYGYEISWQEDRYIGHINTFHTSGWQTRNQFSSLTGYYDALVSAEGSVSQFNHPGPDYGDFEDFSHYTAEYDARISLLEVGSEGGAAAYDAYARALDWGWHVAPTNNQCNFRGQWGDESQVRTVILAKELTEDSLYEAMSARRVYATEDRDLEIYYQLNGRIMGSVTAASGEAEISVELYDPSDAAIGTVEVLAEEETVLVSETVSSSRKTLTLTVPEGHGYYYLRITQPDGDVAVTAPVWTEDFRDVGIGEFSADRQVVTQNVPVNLNLKVFNEETRDFTLNSLFVYAGDTCIHSAMIPGTAKAADSFSYSLSYTPEEVGVVKLRAVVNGSIGGVGRTYEAFLALNVHPAELVAGLLVDGSHENEGLDKLLNLREIALDADVNVTVFPEEMPYGGALLLVSGPGQAFPDRFLQRAADFVAGGGTLMVCGSPEEGKNAELNRLLEAVGASLRLGGSLAEPCQGTVFNKTSPWCENLTEEQFYTQQNGCALENVEETWLVQDGRGNVLLGCEEAGSGRVFAAGGLFLSDENMVLPETFWDVPSANQTILEEILGLQRQELPLTEIADARKAEPGTVLRVKGYVTAGTSNKYNRFRETLYLQDDTGGIAVVPFTDPGISVGVPMEVIGELNVVGGNTVLELIGYHLPKEPSYRHAPKTSGCKAAMDYEKNGGKLLQIQGTVTKVTAQGDAVSRFAVKDRRGSYAEVIIEEEILSGSGGVNTLTSRVKKGGMVRVLGILHRDENGDSVLRVRNCDEVVRVLKSDNPDTGDPFIFAFAGLGAGLTALYMLLKKK